VDGTNTQKPAALTCYRCSQTGHTSWDCDLHHDIRHMTLDEQDKFIQRIMANRDAEMAVVSESMTSACTSEAQWWNRNSTSQILSGPVGE
jgi:hypothetical protein